MRNELKGYAAEFDAQCAELVASGYYKSVRWADNYIEKQFGSLWRDVIGIEADDKPIVDQLKMTDTMRLIVHLFSRTAHRHGNSRSKAPLITKWMPTFDMRGGGGAGGLLRPEAITKRWIGRIIGKSPSAVDAAIGCLRGKPSRRGANGDTYEQFFAFRIAYPSYVDTGIMLDVMVERQCSFAFDRVVYEHAERVAIDAKLNDAETNRKQVEWSREAIRSKASEPRSDIAPADRSHVVEASRAS